MTLLDSWVTPAELFFVRHHHPVPHINPEEYRLVVKGPGVEPASFSLEELRSKFKEHTVRGRVFTVSLFRSPPSLVFPDKLGATSLCAR